MMKILTTFKPGKEVITQMEKLGACVTVFASEEELIKSDEVEEADAIIANHRTLQIDFLNRCKKIRWIHVPHVGIERLPLQYLKERDIIATNARGTAGVPISEHIMTMMLMLARKSFAAYKNQLARAWKSPDNVFNLYNKTVGLLGTGDVGSETAKRAKAFGMRTIGYNTTGEPLEHFDRVYSPDGLNEFLAQCDFIVCTLPPTPKTEYLIDEEQFKCMKSTAYIINISRAIIFNEEVLYSYLKDKKIGGAALDVFMDEFRLGYLPEDSPFWDLDNLIITSHMAGAGDQWNYFSTNIIMHNVQCFCENRLDDMINIRDYDKGY
jgi:phosphoglycerate dehydrogenase-like enzyme